MNKRKKISIILNIIFFAIAVIAITKLWKIYKINDFREFSKAVSTIEKTEFSRDDKIRFSNVYSYKIDSHDYNDALIYKKIKIEKNTPYKISAMVKYENVINKEETSDGGVNISIMNTFEKSESYIGTSDWKEITFNFDSKERESVDIAFRLGFNAENSKGTVWFTNFRIEKGNSNKDNNWNCAFFIIKNIDVSIKDNGIESNTKLSLNSEEISLLKDNMERFKNSIKELSR